MPIAEVAPFVHSLEHVTGFVMVLVALTLLWLLTAGIGRYFIRAGAVSAAVPQPDAAPAGPTDEEVAAISACVALVTGRRSRVVSVQPVARDWSREGRRDHFASHRIR